MKAITKTIILKVANSVVNSGVVEDFLEALASKLDYAATALHSLDSKLEKL
jgi:hypothetical protein